MVGSHHQVTVARKRLHQKSLKGLQNMMQFCCTLPNYKRSFPTKRGLFQHETRDPISF